MNLQYLKNFVKNLKNSDIEVSAFIDPLSEQINYSKEIEFNFIELHTGKYAELKGNDQYKELQKIINQNQLKDFDEARLLPSSKDLESLI